MNIKADLQKTAPRNFVEHLQALALRRAEDTALVVVTECDGETLDTVITYRQLDTRARALAAILQQRFAAGDRALLLLDNNDHYVVAFFACLYAGLIAVPLYPPESLREQHLARLLGIAQDAQARCILTCNDVLAMTGALLEEQSSVEIVAVDSVDDAAAERWHVHSPAAEDIAFLQYTSGSTSAPKGVMVSHGNLMANERAIEQALSITTDDVLVSWLPLFHDMGLIGGLLQPIYRGIKLVLMSPAFFLQRPVRWLEAISRHGGTISGAPDFAYRLCLERVKDSHLARLDLSSWRVAFSGAEPVRHDTLQAFTTRFSVAAFDPRAVCPCFGLAEATLMVSSGRPGSGMETAVLQSAGLQRGEIVLDTHGQVAVVACGVVVDGHRVSIRDSQSCLVCDSNRVGEIWVSGPSIAMGYWQNPEATEKSFVERDGFRWLRTGDLGFVHDDQLYIVGRVKDLIIVRGHNLYPQDIERAIENEVDAVRKGRVAAFAVDGPKGEGIGIAAEVSRSLQKLVPVEKLIEALSVAVSEACGEALSVAVLLNPGALPKTSSGKLQRRACRQGWQEKTLDAYAVYQFGRFVFGGNAEKASATNQLDELATVLADIWVAALKDTDAKTLHLNTHFFAAGGNSLSATQVVAAIESHWRVVFPVRTLFEFPRLSECAAELRRRLAESLHISVEPISVLPAAQRNRPLPLSPAQQRQWFLWRLDPSSNAYHIQGALRLIGELDRDAITTAVAGLVQRHESLRTVFSERADGEAEQCIQEKGALSLQVFDLRGAPDAELETAKALRALNAEPFDLSKGQLVRVALVRIDEVTHILAMVIHHIISDGVSMQILVDELAMRYAAAVEGQEPPDLPPLTLQYVDYAQWQRQNLNSDQCKQQLNYWKNQLGGEQALLALPADYPRQSVAQYQARHYVFQVPDEVSAKLRTLAESSGTTLFTLLLTGFQILLFRYTGQEDIRVGVPVANRTRVEAQTIIGLFVNTLVLRNTLNSRMPLSQLVLKVRDTALDAQAHQDVPFDQLVEALHPERSLSHNPLFQVMFNHLQEDYQILHGLPGLSVNQESFLSEAAQFELTLDTREGADGSLRANFVYASELFDPNSIERMAGHYLRILGALVEQPECPVGDVELLSEVECQQLRAWGIKDQCDPNAESVHRLVERQVQERPDAIAVTFDDEQLTYSELNGRANRLAHYLIKLGVRPETKVGIAMERSIEMVVGLLGILKVGGAYVPLDPEYPKERINYMVEDSRITLLLTQACLMASVEGGALLPILAIDTIDLQVESDHNPDVPLNGDNLVYLIYTSGSTGRPKGAANSHSALCNRLQWGQFHQPLGPADVVLQKTPFSFDISFWEFFWPLMTGAKLVLAGPGEHRDPDRLQYLIDRYQVTTIHFVPSMLQALLDHGNICSCQSIRRIICSGEALPADLQNKVFKTFPQATLHNLYGPTEAAIEVTYWDCKDDDSLTVPIGSPIAGLLTHVLDVELNMVPQGVPGELYLGGAGLARGYWDRPGLTSERFVANPYRVGGGRLYRTGDLVRWNAEGQLEYLGRIDHQVKIRGFRIELGEIEALIREQPAVREAVVVVHGDGDVPRLIAYVSPERQKTVDPEKLKDYLRVALPDYMVPSAIIVMDSLPLNLNGKVDRKALPPPNFINRPTYEPPTGPAAETVAAIWVEVLGVAQVGIHDNFFDLGGHSLLLIRVHRLLEQRLHIGLSIVDLFQYPTISSLVGRLENAQNSPAAELPAQEQNERAKRRRAALTGRRRAIERAE